MSDPQANVSCRAVQADPGLPLFGATKNYMGGSLLSETTSNNTQTEVPGLARAGDASHINPHSLKIKTVVLLPGLCPLS